MFAANGRAEDPKQPAKIRVAIFSGDGVTKSDPAQIKACLPESQGFAVKLIAPKEVLEGGLTKFDVVIHPGGSGSGQAESLGEDGRERVRQFVRHGGGYVGVCAGAYLASAEYPWALKLLDARVVDDEHWARGVGNVRMRVPKEGQAALGSDDVVTAIHYKTGRCWVPPTARTFRISSRLRRMKPKFAKTTRRRAL
jgi:biotin protein ligase-like protein